jgi:hypothetical protein
MMRLATSCLASEPQTGKLAAKARSWREARHAKLQRAVLDEVMTKIPLENVTPGIKAHMAEVILKAASEGRTTYDGLLAAASDQIQTIVSMLT